MSDEMLANNISFILTDTFVVIPDYMNITNYDKLSVEGFDEIHNRIFN